MTTEKQIHANRENSQLSTGPVYNPDTFRVLACENQAQYDALLKALTEEQTPQDPPSAEPPENDSIPKNSV